MAGKPAHPRAEALAKLKLLRARHGLSVTDAAKALGMSRATAYRILEAGTYHGKRAKTR